MTTSKINNATLREQAEDKHSKQLGITLENLSEFDTNRLVHEFEVHQIELEMQNDQLVQALTDLSNLKSMYEALFDQSAVGITIVNSDNRKFINVNRKFCQLLGYEPDELIGHDFLEITFEEDRNTSYEHYSQLRSGNIAEFSVDKRFIHKNGHFLWMNVSVSTLRMEGSAQQLNIVITKDISVSKQAESELASYSKELEEANTALRVFMDRRERDQKILEEKLQMNVDELVLPYTRCSSFLIFIK